MSNHNRRIAGWIRLELYGCDHTFVRRAALGHSRRKSIGPSVEVLINYQGFSTRTEVTGAPNLVKNLPIKSTPAVSVTATYVNRDCEMLPP